MFNFISSKFLLAFGAGLVAGAIGYKLVSEKKINPQALQKTVMDLAGKFKTKEDTEAANEQKQ